MERKLSVSPAKIALSLVLLVIVVYLMSYLLFPTNVGYTVWVCIVIIGLAYVSTIVFDVEPIYNGIALVTGIIALILLLSLIFSPMIFTRIDNAKYFDSQLHYANDLPFNTRINGSELRVVDMDLAHRIMDKSNPFGSDTAVNMVHLGNYQGRIYWIGAAIFDGIILSDAKNRIQGFIAVDITDPTKAPVIIEQEFEVSDSLIFNHNLDRTVWFHDINYIPGDNAYFSFNDKKGQMELIVPYAIRDSAFFGDTNGGMVTSDMHLDGGVMIINSIGDVIEDIRDRSQLPSHAKIQVYSEQYLERAIGYWGSSLVDDHDVEWSAGLPWVKSPRKLGVDDDVRVVINPDNFNTMQYILLDSTDSTNQILRGAIKANETGLFYYNWEQYQFIDTNTAHEHVEETITNIRQTSTHGYKSLLPILYPFRENVTDLTDYAYIMPLQLGESRFGGIAITDPSDKTGTRTIVEFVESEQSANVSETVAAALDKYIALIDGESHSGGTQQSGDFTISDKRAYIENGATVYAIDGNLTGFATEIRVIFSRDYITSDQQWLEVVFANSGDILNIVVDEINGIYYATEITI